MVPPVPDVLTDAVTTHLSVSPGIPSPSGQPDGAKASPADLSLHKNSLWSSHVKKKKFHFDVLVSTRVAPTESVPALTITRASLQGPAFSLTKLLHVVQNNKDTEGSRRKRNYFFILWLGLLQSREEIWFWILQCFHASHSTSGMLWIEAQGNVVVSSEPHNAHRCCSTLLALMYSCTVCLTAPDLWSMCIPKGHGVARKSKIIWKHHT